MIADPPPPLPAPASDKEKWARLRLIRSENVGPVTFRHLLRRYGSAMAALEAVPDLAAKGGRGKPVALCSRAAAEAEWAATKAAGADYVFLGEAAYPPALAQIEDAPPVLTWRGHLHLAAKAGLAVVGARNASAVGVKIARDIAARAGKQGWPVISGLARGIDTAAHYGGLETGTIAVLAGGVDVVYPPENRALYDQIAETGLLLSEIPAGTEPQAGHFPRRNRLVSGLGFGVLVVEASLKSGSLITARLAAEQGREVFAVPGSPLDPRCRGGNDLIRNGAVLTEGIEDILAAMAHSHPLREPPPPAPDAAPAPPEEAEIAAGRARILQLLGPTAIEIDELIHQSELTPAVLFTILLELELAGRLARTPGQKVALLG